MLLRRRNKRKHVKGNASWVGYIDWELESFHGDDYSIMKGWTNDNRMMITCCNDGTRPVIFKIERIDIPETPEEEEWLAKQNFRNSAEDASEEDLSKAFRHGIEHHLYNGFR